METRRHDLSDAFAIIGTTSQPRKVTGYSSEKMQIRAENGRVVFELDKEKGSVSVQCSGDFNVKASGEVKIQGSNGVNIGG